MIISRELFFYLISKKISIIYTALFENLKARFLKNIIMWSEMGQQTVQAKEVYYKGMIARIIKGAPTVYTIIMEQLCSWNFGWTF